VRDAVATDGGRRTEHGGCEETDLVGEMDERVSGQMWRPEYRELRRVRRGEAWQV